MDPSFQPKPTRSPDNCSLVRNVLALLATHHPSIRPDDVAHLPEDLLDWNKLVEVDFVAQWRDSIARMKTDDHRCIRESGVERERRFAGRNTLRVLFDAAKSSREAFGDLQCAAIELGNLIEDAVILSHPELARVLQLQVNSFWNASANRALGEHFGDGRIVANLPEYNPRAPELKDDGTR